MKFKFKIGEARTLEQLDEYGEINEFVSTAKGILQNLIEKHFPSMDIPSANPTSTSSPSQQKQNINKNNNPFFFFQTNKPGHQSTPNPSRTAAKSRKIPKK